MTNRFHTHTDTQSGGFTLWNLAFQSWNAKQCLSAGSPACQKHVESGFFSQRTFCVLSGPSAERKEEGRTVCSKLVLCWFYWSVVIKGMGTSLFSEKSMVKGPRNWIHLFNMWTYGGSLLWGACHGHAKDHRLRSVESSRPPSCPGWDSEA